MRGDAKKIGWRRGGGKEGIGKYRTGEWKRNRIGRKGGVVEK